MDDFAPADVADHHSTTTASTAVSQSVDTLAYPISPEYVKSWTLTYICQAKLLVKQLRIFQPCEARSRESAVCQRRPGNRSERPPRGVGVGVPEQQSQLWHTYTDRGTRRADLGRPLARGVVLRLLTEAARYALEGGAWLFADRDGWFDGDERTAGLLGALRAVEQ